MPYCGKRFWTRQIPTSCLPTCLVFIHIETGSRNLMGPKTLPTIWGTYLKLVTKYQISTINSCWEKCDEKLAYMFNVYKNQQSQQTGSRNLMAFAYDPEKLCVIIPSLPEGEGGILFYLCSSVLPSVQDIFRIYYISIFKYTGT
jgi:hypothetical protein